MIKDIKLTNYSRNMGCGSKIPSDMLKILLDTQQPTIDNSSLIIDNESHDDAAVIDIGNGIGLINSLDFIMPIVDDPFTFGVISATHSISDIYAMGGSPIMATAIFAWPLELPLEVGQQVLEGGRKACFDAGIKLVGGHSINAAEPIFGLSVNGTIKLNELKRNNTAQVGDYIYLTKPLGIGILSAAHKKNKLEPNDNKILIKTMSQLNTIGSILSNVKGVTAMTDVTGFGLMGHLYEVCKNSYVNATLNFKTIPLLPNVDKYLNLDCIPCITKKNCEYHNDILKNTTPKQRHILCDPQTSGGLLITVNKEYNHDFLKIMEANNLFLKPIGTIEKQLSKNSVEIKIK